MQDDPLFHQMADTYAAAFAPGTLQNRARQAKTYLAFMFTYDFPILSPSTVHILVYTQHLSNSFKNVTSIKNYLSGAKNFILQAGGDPTPFHSPQLTNMLRGVTRLSLHVPSQAPAIPLPYFKRLCDLMEVLGGDAASARAALLIGYATFLRQSNLLLGSGPEHAHTLG